MIRAIAKYTFEYPNKYQCFDINDQARICVEVNLMFVLIRQYSKTQTLTNLAQGFRTRKTKIGIICQNLAKFSRNTDLMAFKREKFEKIFDFVSLISQGQKKLRKQCNPRKTSQRID